MEKKVMSDYSLYCTEEQTKKALELGTPLKQVFYSVQFDEILKEYHLIKIEDKLYEIPTAEQMIGFFRTKNIHIVIQKDVVDKWSVYGHEIEPIEFTIFDRLTGYNSFKEATLSAIDAALEYLSKNKQ